MTGPRTRGLAFAVALALASPASAQVPIATGPLGELGVWRLLEEARRSPSGEALAALSPDDCADCPLVAQGSERVDLKEATRRGTRFAALGLSLEATEPTRIHLFFGASARMRVLVDGEVVLTRVGSHVVEDEAHVAVPLSAGRHALVLALEAPERGAWSVSARMLGATFEPGPRPAALDAGRAEGVDEALLLRQAIHLHEEVSFEPLAVRAHASFPGGGPARPLRFVREDSAVVAGPRRGVWSMAITGVFPVPARGMPGELRVEDEVLPVGRRLMSQRRLLVAAGELAATRPPSASVGPVRWRLREIRRALEEGERDRRWLGWLETEARRLVRALDGGGDPFGELSGYVRMGHVSRLDSTAQPYELFVPRGRPPRAGWPLVITLHGFKGNAGDYFRNTFGLSRNWQGGETLDAHGRHGTPPTRGPMVVIAPQARGQTMYRDAGEIDVLEALADVRSRLPIDPLRIYVTGGSMGGTGAAYLPLRHPDLFAAAAPLAGYHDQSVRRDTHHPGLSPVERFLFAQVSDVTWAENALHLPMLLVRGQRDRPREWTSHLASRLGELHADVEHREPDLRHNVWTETYADGAIFEWFARHRRPADPAHVRLRTARERTRSAWWVTVERARADAFGQVDATIDGDRLVLVTEGLREVRLDPPARRGRAATLAIDGQSLEVRLPARLRRRGDRWAIAGDEAAPLPALGRPVRDVYHEPLVFVVGTQDPAHTAMNRLVARHWARPIGWDVEYPVVDDVDVTDASSREATLVLIGPPSSNAVLARIADRLPIRFGPDAVTLAGARYEGREVGAVFRTVWPGTTCALLVVAGPTPLGTWRSRFLPETLAEYAIFDGGVANGRGEMTCGGAKRDRLTGAGVGATANDTTHGAVPVPCRFLAHGFFR